MSNSSEEIEWLAPASLVQSDRRQPRERQGSGEFRRQGSSVRVRAREVRALAGEAYQAYTAVDPAHYRALEIARLEGLTEAHEALAAAGSRDSAELLLKIMDRRSKLLGLDEPAKLALTVATPEILDLRNETIKETAEKEAAMGLRLLGP